MLLSKYSDPFKGLHWSKKKKNPHNHFYMKHFTRAKRIPRELSGRVLDSRPKGREFERHCVVVLEQDAFILA